MAIQAGYSTRDETDIQCSECSFPVPAGVAYAPGWIWITYKTTADDFNIPFCSWHCLATGGTAFAEVEVLTSAER